LTKAGRPLAALGLFAMALAGVAAIDAATRRVQLASERAARLPETAAPSVEAPTRSRVFMLLVDSFRAETAVGLPAFQALRARGAFVRVRCSQDAATVPSIRAAFTGQAQRSVFSFARNFVHVGGGWESVFTDLSARGRRSTVFSDGSFSELAPGITSVRDNEVGPGDEDARARRAFAESLARFQAGGDELVVFHLTTADHASHAGGVHGPHYAAAFATVDALIAQAEAAVPADATLVVFGDHGHDVDGRHFPGLDVPTVAVYRGPGFAPGAEAGPLPLTIHRYLLDWSLGLPLSAAYRGAAATELLRAGAAVPPAFAAPPPEVSSVARSLDRLVWMLPFYLVLAAALALAASRSPWLAGRAPRPPVAIGAAKVLVAAFVAWGYFLVQRRLTTEPQGSIEMIAIWLVGMGVAAALVAAGLLEATTAAWLALAVPALMLYPSAARDSWAAGMGRLWSIAMVALVVGWARRRFVVERGGHLSFTFAEKLALASLPFVAFCTLPFFYVEADGFVFGNWRGYLTLDWMGFWIVLATGARCVLLLRPHRGVPANVSALGLIALLSLVSFGEVLPTQMGRLGCAGVLAALAVAARASRGVRDAASPLTNVALLMAFRGSVVLDERQFLQLELSLAALRVSQLLADVLAAPGRRRQWDLWLEAMALVVVAWSTLALTLHRLEWRFLYDFVSPPVVERRVGLFLPLILARYTLPLVLARRLLAEARERTPDDHWLGSYAVAAAKVVTLTLIATGYGLFDPTSELFAEAVQNALTFSAPLLALAYQPRPGHGGTTFA
jgi:hypothetical protein